MNVIPKDPVMLLSYVNMKLRDKYASLDLLCEDLGLFAVNEEADMEMNGKINEKINIEETLAGIGYHYDAGRNQFL